jgi:hypothetical protein
MKRENRSVRFALLPVGLLGLVIFSAAAAVADEPEEKTKPVIVMIKSSMPSGDEESGAGIIFGEKVGQRGNTLFIVTANHVVRQGPQEATKVRVRFKWGEEFDAGLADTNPEADWAVLKVENVDPPSDLSFAQLGDAGSLKKKDKVFLIGNPAGHRWYVTATPGSVKDITADSVYFETQNLEPGYSGGALLDEDMRVVGLLKNSQPPLGEAANIHSLLETLKDSGYPVKLEPRGGKPQDVPPAPRPAGPAAGPSGDSLLDGLAAKGEIIAGEDPLVAAIRAREPDGPIRRGFDIGMAACEGHTLWGPGKQKILDSLSPAEQRGFVIARDFSLERNNNIEFAAKGAAIAAKSKDDPELAAARAMEPPGLYTLGFDIATGIFGNPALGAQGNTATGPGSLGIRDKLSAAGQRGFNAAVKLHLSRNYRK